jgi:hypothetical protein
MLKYAHTAQQTTATTLKTSRNSLPGSAVTLSKVQLLLICDSAAAAARLRSALNLGAVEIVCVSDEKSLRRAGNQTYALAVVDVNPTHLAAILKTIRTRKQLAGLPVFVEASGILAEPSLSGLLPRYRAMPCGLRELIALTRHELAAPGYTRTREGKVL